MQHTLKNRTIFCRDNLEVLGGIDSGTVDLIYLDPPFNKKKQFTSPIGSSAEGASFLDVFKEEDVKEEWIQTIEEDHEELHDFLMSVKRWGGVYNFAYLAYMAIRILEMRRILKDTGSIYLHCDSTMSHYLKLLMDCVFGEKCFRNEVVWCYHGPGSPNMKQFNRKSDAIFWYSKGSHWVFNANEVRVPYKDPNQSLRRAMSTTNTFTKEEVIEYRKKGKIPENWWELRIAARSKEYVGYPTQKPLALLERIIKASSNEGDFVLDPFCGCATTSVAAERLGRKWVGIDVSVKAYELLQKRLKKEVANPEDYVYREKGLHFSTSPPKRTDVGSADLEQKYVYVISNVAYPGEYKVGIAKSWKARLNAYQTSDPNRAYKLEYKLETPHFRAIERHIHEVFDSKHEWVRGALQLIRNKILLHDQHLRV